MFAELTELLFGKESLGDYYQLDEKTGSAADLSKVVHIPIQGLEIGCELHLITTKERLSPPTHLPYEDWIASQNYPCHMCSYTLEAPSELVAVHNPGDVPIKISNESLEISVKSPPIYRHESKMSNVSAAMMVVSFGDKRKDWQKIAKDYLDELQPYLDSTSHPFITNLPKDMISGILELQKRFTYTAVAFGERGRIPHHLDTICEKRSGDCKDHSIALYHYLKQIGPKLALVSEFLQA